MKRRSFIQKAGVAAVGLGSVPMAHGASALPLDEEKKLNHNINHSVCRWCFGDMPLEDLLDILRKWGVKAIDLIGPEDWPLLKEKGVHCSMCNGAEISLTEGWNNPKYHETLIANYLKMIPRVAEAGYTNLICFSGNREGLSDLVGIQNCVEGLSQIIPLAEKHGVVIQMELFNQVNHPDYMADSTLWGVELCRRLGSPNFKLLYDIYHMQIQEGDIIRTIQDYHSYLGHYHTAGVPGRHEIGDDQELNYPAIMRAIQETGFKGYVAQEFIPTAEEPLDSLKEAFRICDV